MKRGLSLGWSLWLACLICGFSRGAVLLHEDWNSGHIDTSRWEYAGMPINSSLVDLGGGDWRSSWMICWGTTTPASAVAPLLPAAIICAAPSGCGARISPWTGTAFAAPLSTAIIFRGARHNPAWLRSRLA